MEDRVSQMDVTDIWASPHGSLHETLEEVESSTDDEFSLVFTSSFIYMFEESEVEEEEGPVKVVKKASIDLMHTDARFMEYLDKKQSSWMSLDDIVTATTRRLTKQQRYKLPASQDNAFAVEIVAVYPEHRDSVIYLFMHAFACYQDREYAIVSIPTDASPGLFLSYFNRIPLKAGGTCQNVLYAMHRNSLLCELEVQPACMKYREPVKHLLVETCSFDKAWDIFVQSLDDVNSQYAAYVLLSNTQVVGVAVLLEEYDLKYLNSHYDVDKWAKPKLHKSGCFGVLEYCLIAPQYHSHAKYFLRELHRYSDFNIIYYKLKLDDLSLGANINNLLQTMVPVMPREQIYFDREQLEDCLPEEEVLRKSSLGLFLSTMNNCGGIRLVNNTRVVVVGDSTTAMSFLETLCWACNDPSIMLTFNSVILVCSHGLVPPIHRINDFRVKTDLMHLRLMSMLYYKTFVTVVRGSMTSIDRKEKYICVNESMFLPYDLLFLMCGEQFQTPVPRSEEEVLNPHNVFVLNSEVDYIRVYGYIKHLKKHTNRLYVDGTILIYGHCVEAYSMLAASLEFGMEGQDLVLVEPFPYLWHIQGTSQHNVSFFNNPKVDEIVMRTLEDLGIRIYKSYQFYDWNCDVSKKVTTVRFQTAHNIVELPCSMFIIYNQRSVAPKTFTALTDAGLVFDGRLVIDKNFRTNDKFIYAAGTMTKYSRRYYAGHMVHKYFNRVEVGNVLGKKIRNMFTPFWVRPAKLPMSDRLLPTYSGPKLHYAILPGKLYYLCVEKPGRKIPLQLAITRPNYGTVLTTGGDTLDKQGYFRLHLNQFDCVETITCLSKTEFNLVNVVALWGKHEKLLNNLKIRNRTIGIKDLYTYFKEPWSYALYHDKMGTLMDDIKQYLMELNEPGEDRNIMEALQEALIETQWKRTDTVRLDYRSKCVHYHSAHNYIYEKLMEFLENNRQLLTMYATPSVIRMLLRQVQSYGFT